MTDNENLIPIPGRLHSVATEGHVSGADEIYDDVQQKDQETINSELIEAVGIGGSVDTRITNAVNVEKTRAEGKENTLATNLSNEVTRATDAEDALDSKITAEQTRATSAENALDDRVDTLEEAVGTGGSIDSRIASAVATETSRAQGAESTLQNGITTEVNRAQEAETELDSRVTTNESNIESLQEAYRAITQSQPIPKTSEEWAAMTSWEEGVVYRVQGTTSYADYMYNGTTTIKMAEYDNAIDDVPTAESNNLVKSGGVQQELALGAIYDVSAKNPTGGSNNDGKWESLSALLEDANLDTLIPISVRKGGMSIKFIRSSDNNYVQYRLKSTDFNTTVTNWESENVDDMPTEGSGNAVSSDGVYKVTDSIGVLYDNDGLSLQNLHKRYYGNFKAGKKVSLKALNVVLEGSGWYNIALHDGTDYVIVLNQPVSGDMSEVTLPRDCTHLQVDINASDNRTTVNIDYIVEYNLLTESTKVELTSLQKKETALSKGIILSSENNYAKIEQILLFNAYTSNSAYKSLMLGVVDKNGGVYGIQMFDSGNLIDNRDFTATINGTIAHIKGWLNKGIAYIDAYFDTESYVQIASANSGLVIPLQDAALLNEQATPYDSSILTESGLMNSQGVVGDTSFHHSPKISLDGVSDIWLTTKMVTTDSNYARIVFFKGNEVTNAYAASSGGVESTDFRKGIHWQDADSFVVNCYNSSFSDFSMTVCKNTLTETEIILNTHIRHNTPYIVDASGNGDFSSLTEAVATIKDSNDVTLLVNNGTYNLISEFETLYGSDFFTNYPSTEPPMNKKGIVLNNRVKIIFSSNSKVTCNYTGSNTGVMKYFSPFNAGKYGFELIGLNLECSNVRYGIHDERYNGGDDAKADDYTNIYRYCSIKLDNRNSQGLGTNQCIGGGLGYQGNIIIEGCYFESQVSNDSIVSYHNHAQANSKSKIVANNNFVAGPNGFRFSWYGASTLITEIYLSGNSVGKATVVSAETQDATINNINVTEWNTNLRN